MKFSLFVVFILSTFSLFADELPPQQGWRTDGTGMYPHANPPLKWSMTENVIWKTKMPSWSNSQPAILKDRLFVCSEPDVLVCLKLSDGEILWQRSNGYNSVASAEEWKKAQPQLEQAAKLQHEKRQTQQQIQRLESRQIKTEEKTIIQKQAAKLQKEIENIDRQLEHLPLAKKWKLPNTKRRMNGYTTATPTTDGRFVWAVFGNSVVCCYDLDGNRQWVRKLSDDPHAMFGHSASPLLVENTLIVTIKNTIAFDALSGKELWRAKYGRSWGSAVLAKIGGEKVIALANGRFVRVSDGKILGRAINLADSSPLVQKNLIYYIQQSGSAIRLPKTIGKKFEFETLWVTQPRGSRFFASPVYHEGFLYTVSSRGILNVIDAKSGKVVSRKRLDMGHATVYSSVVLAGHYLIVTSENGTMLVLDANEKGKLVSSNKLERIISTPIFSGNRMYVRTHHSLFCIGE